ncbi:hypothetical protein A1D29_07875 [Pasteurellaceae bacterium Orientalotternb1]|nr:hypothetical protein A1D29_07875 [Pasteurellaceae bacterium Orientalotternb1]
MKQNRTYSIVVVTTVAAFHLLLGWGIAQIPLQKLTFEEIGNLQMVEVNLGVEAATSEVETVVESVSIPEPEVMPEIQPEPEPLPQDPPQQEIVTTDAKNEPVDIVKTPPKLVEKPTPKKEPPKPKKKAEKKPPKEKTPQVAKNSGKAAVSPSSNQPIGSPKGIAGSTSTQGNSSVSASLGAGFGRSMKGSCSDISNEAEDKGTVGMKVLVSETGKAANVEIISSSGIKRLDNQAKRSAKSHIYNPAKENGKPVQAYVQFNFVFNCGTAA